MKTIHEIARKTPIMTETDVLVVGSGPAGLAAALASARTGVKTLLVERFGCFGGNITQVGVEGFAWYRHEKTIDSEGIGPEFEQRAKAMGGTHPEPQSQSHTLDADMFKYVADTLVEEAGVEPLLHCMIVDVLMDGNQIIGVITESKSGRAAILAKRIIDATGDADVAYRAGVPTYKTPKEEMMAVSVMFSCAGIDKSAFIEHIKANPTTYDDWRGDGTWSMETTGKEDHMFSPFLKKPFKQAQEAGVIPKDVQTIGGTWSTITDSGEATYLNVIHIPEIDGTDIRDLTRGEMQGRRDAIHAINALKQFTPGFERAKLRNFGMTLGIRDTRKIQACYAMTEHDVREQGQFQDSIGIFPEFIDGYGILILPITGRYFQVPLRALLPEKVENLLVAGRSIAGDKVSHAGVRNMMCCAVTGQGAGTAAALSVKHAKSIRDLPIDLIQQEILKQGGRVK